jgi:hypothetical protein
MEKEEKKRGFSGVLELPRIRIKKTADKQVVSQPHLVRTD